MASTVSCLGCGHSIAGGAKLGAHRQRCQDWHIWLELNKAQIMEEYMNLGVHKVADKYHFGAQFIYKMLLSAGLVTLSEIPKSYQTRVNTPRLSETQHYIEPVYPQRLNQKECPICHTRIHLGNKITHFQKEHTEYSCEKRGGRLYCGRCGASVPSLPGLVKHISIAHLISAPTIVSSEVQEMEGPVEQGIIQVPAPDVIPKQVSNDGLSLIEQVTQESKSIAKVKGWIASHRALIADLTELISTNEQLRVEVVKLHLDLREAQAQVAKYSKKLLDLQELFARRD